MKDRKSLAAYVVALEAIVVPLARRALAAMTESERAAFAKDAGDCVAQAGSELIEGAAIMRHGTVLTPDQAKAAARNISDDAAHAVTEFLLELTPAHDGK